MSDPKLVAKAMAAHHYQFDGSHANRNECALCAMATVLQRAAQQANRPPLQLAAAELGRFLDRIPFRFTRFPAWFPGPGGATHPHGAWRGLNAYLHHLQLTGQPLHWQAVLRMHQSTHDLAAAMQAGELVLIYGVGSSGIPHVVHPVAKDAQGWQILDPGYPAEMNPRRWSESELTTWWRNFGWLYPQRTLVSLVPLLGSAK